MARRIGRRKDQKPVLMEVIPDRAQKKGARFYPFGGLFLARIIPAGSLAGPPLSKAARKALESKAVDDAQGVPDILAGTFTLKPMRNQAPTRRYAGKKNKGWKEDAKKLRRRSR
jgi:putative RNA 2'-phosphotransferase